MRDLRLWLFLVALAAGAVLLVPPAAASGASSSAEAVPEPSHEPSGEPSAEADGDAPTAETPSPTDEASLEPSEEEDGGAANTEAGPEAEAAPGETPDPKEGAAEPRGWLTRLNPFRPIPRPKPPEPPEAESAGPETVPLEPPAASAAEPEPPEPVVLRLSGILVSGGAPGTRMALVNDAIVQVGDLVGGYVITEIEPAYVAARKDGADYVMTPLRPMAQAAERIEPTADAVPADSAPSGLGAAPPQDAVPVPTEPGPKSEAAAAEAKRLSSPGFFFEVDPPALSESPSDDSADEDAAYAPIPPPAAAEPNRTPEQAKDAPAPVADAKDRPQTTPRAAARSTKNTSAGDRRPDTEQERRSWLNLPDPFADVVLPTPIGLMLPGRGED
jgi:hypothetical protein